MYTILFGLLMVLLIWLSVCLFVPNNQEGENDGVMWISIITILIIGGIIILYLD